jgi:hypothetical protein
MKNLKEEKCGRVDFEKLADAKEDIGYFTKDGHLMSCGGVYLPRGSSEVPRAPFYQFLHLSNTRKPFLFLKNFEVQRMISNEEDEWDLFAKIDGEEILEQNPPHTVKKVFKERLN